MAVPFLLLLGLGAMAAPIDMVEAVNRNLQLVVMNDVHNRIEPAGNDYAMSSCNKDKDATGVCYGGWARISGYINKVRSTFPDVLVLDIGDQYMGTAYDTLYRGNLTADLFNYARVDYSTLGNHEFDYGVAQLVSTIKRFNHTIMLGLCNTVTSGAPELGKVLRKWSVIKRRGVYIGLVSSLNPSTADTNVQKGDNVTFTDPIKAVQKCIADMRYMNRGRLDLVIYMSHNGYDEDLVAAAQLPDVDIILGSHSHTYLNGPQNVSQPGPLLVLNTTTRDTPAGPYPTYVKSTANPLKKKPVYVFQALYGSRYIGHINITLNYKKDILRIDAAPVLLGGNASSNEVKKDPVLNAIIMDKWSVPVSQQSEKVAGQLANDLDSTNVRIAETTIGNAVTDSMLYYVNTMTQLKDVDIAFVNSGVIRAGLNKGDVTQGDVYSALPYSNVIIVRAMTGATIVQALESGVSLIGASAGTGRFPQVAGLRYVYNASNPVGSRITKAVLLANSTESDIEACKIYNVAITDYMGAGGDGYTMFQFNATDVLSSGPPLSQLLINYLADVSKVEPLAVPLQDRIVACSLPAANGPPLVLTVGDATCGAAMQKPVCASSTSSLSELYSTPQRTQQGTQRLAFMPGV